MNAFEDALDSSVRIRVKLEIRHTLEDLDPSSLVKMHLQTNRDSDVLAGDLLFSVTNRGQESLIPIRGFSLPRGASRISFEGTAAAALEFFELIWPIVAIRD